MVIGAGAGIGGNVAKRFAKEGFHSVLCRRSNQHGLDDLVRDIEKDGLVLPDKVADTYYHLSKQHRSAWTYEIDLRSFSDNAWWNHPTLNI